LKKGLAPLSELARFRRKNSPRSKYVTAGRQVSAAADALRPDKSLIGSHNLLLTGESYGFNRKLLHSTVVQSCRPAVVAENAESILVHAAKEHGVCFQQLEAGNPRSVRALVSLDGRFRFLLAHRQIATLKKTQRMAIGNLGASGLSIP
jgi:hypothetical protein